MLAKHDKKRYSVLRHEESRKDENRNRERKKMELRVLRYFLATAREGSITAAARALHVTQPTLSRQLRDLEDELGQTLLVRSNHCAELTPEGMLLRKRAEQILELVEKTESEFSSMGEVVAGDVRIGGGETEAMSLIAEVIREFREDFPDVRCHIHSGNAQDVTERLEQGRLDFGVLIQPVDLEKYNHLDLPAKDVWGVVMRKDHPLAQKDSIAREDLRGVPLLCSRQVLQDASIRNDYAEWFGPDFLKWNIVATYNLIYNAALMVKEGVGCAVTLDRLVNVTGSDELCFRPLSPRLESGLSVVWKKYQIFSTADELFLDRIREKVRAAKDS